MARKRLAARFIEALIRLPYSTLGIFWVHLVLLFAAAYFGLHEWLPQHGPSPLAGETVSSRLGNSIYYSIMTATTVGYGDIIPHGISKVLASIQAIGAFFIFGICVGKIVSGKQEIALREIRRLTFEDVFRNTREGLYIIRKDIDHAIEAAVSGDLGKHHDENLSVAYKQMQTLLMEIPDFYNADAELYTIDPEREQLLQEAVHRTLQRINQMLDAVSAKGIAGPQDTPGAPELEKLLGVIERITPLWKEQSPHKQHEGFEDILRQSKKIDSRMGKTVK
jgi:hypothetical protein